MKRLWRLLPGAIRWVLVTLLILLIVGGGVWAYVALTATGEITIEECLSFVGDSTFTISLYPQGSDVGQVTLANASPDAIEVDLLSEVTPDPGPKGLTVDIPAKITVPASGQIAVDITVTASKSVEPGIYTVSIEFDR